jgi:hypothetical protein
VNAAAGTGDLRISDADRDRAIAQLSDHFQVGRLTTEEFQERSGIALQAKTGRELAVLFTDLPQDRVPATQPGQATAARRSGLRLPVVLGAAGAVAVAAIVGAILADGHNISVHIGFGGLLPVLIVFLIIRRRGGFGGGPGPRG